MIFFLRGMFTGIVEECGTVHSIKEKKNLFVLTVSAKKVLRGAILGGSVAVDGVCLTVVAHSNVALTFDVMKETLEKTTLRYLRIGSKVNLERPLKAANRINGHFVQGHIDDIGTITRKISQPNYIELRIAIKKSLIPFIVPKGSVCLDGISLTVGKVWDRYFSIYIIPHTLKITTLGHKGLLDKVNIETDILAKYIRNPKKLKQLLSEGYFKRSRYSAVFGQ